MAAVHMVHIAYYEAKARVRQSQLVDFDHDLICSPPDLRDAVMPAQAQRDLKFRENAPHHRLDALLPTHREAVDIRAADCRTHASVAHSTI